MEDSDSETELLGEEMRDNTVDDDEESNGVESDHDGSELRRRDALEHMARIEQEFADLKDRLFQEKMGSLKKELEQISRGVHPEFLENLLNIEKKRDERTRYSEMWKNYLLETIQNNFASEKEAIENEFNSEKQQLRDRLTSANLEKQKRLEEEKNSIDIITEIVPDSTKTAQLRKSRRREVMETRPVRRRITGPAISYTLTEAEITEDIYLIKRVGGVPNTTRRNAASKFATKDPTEKEHEVTIENNVLYIDKVKYEKNMLVIIEGKEQPRISGNIANITSSELWIRKGDNTKTKVPLAQVRNGKISVKQK